MAPNATLKSTWTNGIIAVAIILAVGLGLRLGLWYGVIWMDMETFTDAFATNSGWMFSVSVVLPIIFSVISYKGYMDRAAQHPTKLAQVARGEFGRPWVLGLILTVVLELVWIGVTTFIIYIACDLGTDVMGRTMLNTFLGFNGAFLAADILTFLLGARFLKPNTIMGSSS